MRTPHILALTLIAGLLATALPAEAVYIATPLHLEAETQEADVGDDIDFTISPNPDDANATRDHAGTNVTIRFSYDRDEDMHHDPDESTSSSDSQVTGTIRDTLTLDSKASGQFTWTIPESVDDRNVLVSVVDANGEQLASLHLAIGDAEPMMYATGVGDGREIDDGANGDGTDGAGDGADGAGDTDDEAAEAPGVGILAALSVLGLVAVTLRIRRL